LATEDDFLFLNRHDHTVGLTKANPPGEVLSWNENSLPLPYPDVDARTGLHCFSRSWDFPAERPELL
jgi:hypothetical protein